MTNRTLTLDDNLYQYLLDTSLRETPLLKRLRDETAQLTNAQVNAYLPHLSFIQQRIDI